MTLLEGLGTVGALVVTYSNIPQMWQFVKQGHAIGISISSTWIGLVGLLLRTVYLAKVTHLDPIALGPYIFAILCVLLTLFYIYFPGDQNEL